MSGPFRVGISGDFHKPDGSPVFPDFDLTPLKTAPGLELVHLSGVSPIPARDVEDIDALILLTSPFNAASIHPNRRLGAVVRFGVGYNSVDVPALTAAGVVLVITPDGVRRPVAVSIITLMLALTGRLLVKDRLARQGPAGFAARDGCMGMGLVGRTLGSVGMGNIGSEMFRLAKPFDMRFIAHDPFADAGVAAGLGVELVALDEVFAQSDIVTVNCPLTDSTHHLVDARRLALMRPAAWLVNTSRGPIVDQKALTLVLQQRRIAGAGLDVFDVEPPDAADPLLALDNVVLTPHALCWTDQCFAGVGAADVQAVLDLQAGRVPRGVVNTEVLGAPAFRARLEDHGRQKQKLGG